MANNGSTTASIGSLLQNPLAGITNLVGSRTSTSAASPTTAPANSAPPKATAAPTAANGTIIKGLCDILNDWQQGLVKSGVYTTADRYNIVFVPPELGAATLKKPGSTDDTTTGMQNPSTAKQIIDPATNSRNTNNRSLMVEQGKSIIQLIDEVMKGSSYISNQLKATTNELTGNSTPSTPANKDTAWYNITCQAVPLGDTQDPKRNDWAMDMTYIVSTYNINQTRSPYVNQPSFKGVSKSYNYWFTGENTEILKYEQVIDNNFWMPLTDASGTVVQQPQTDSKILYKQFYATRSGTSDKGGANGVNEPMANAQDSLVNAVDFAKINLTIIGDPAWIPQGDTTGTTSAKNFNFSGFYNDGTINFESGEVLFDVNFKTPSDFNLGTGIMDVNATGASSTAGNPTSIGQNATYLATQVVSRFFKGRFEQDLEGTLLTSVPIEGPVVDKTPLTPTVPAAATASAQGVGVANNVSNTTAQLNSLLQNPLAGITNIARTGIGQFNTNLNTLLSGSTNPTPGIQSTTSTASSPAVTPAGPPDPVTTNGVVANPGNVPAPQFINQIGTTLNNAVGLTNVSQLGELQTQLNGLLAGQSLSSITPASPIYGAVQALQGQIAQAQAQLSNPFRGTLNPSTTQIMAKENG